MTKSIKSNGSKMSLTERETTIVHFSLKKRQMNLPFILSTSLQNLMIDYGQIYWSIIA